MYKRDECATLARIPGDLFGDFRNETLTICPYLAKDLLWRRTATNPLELYDQAGLLVARTVRWIEGTHQKPGFGAELSGAGQAFVLTATGRSQIEAKFGALKMGTRVVATVIPETGDKSSREISAVD
jgi:hypothetical protein